MSDSPIDGYDEVATPDALRKWINSTWRFRQGDLDVKPVQVLPDGYVDVIWDGSGLFVAGPDSHAAMASLSPGSTLTGIRLAPATGAGLLGVPLDSIADQRVALADLWGSRAFSWQDRLHDGDDATRVLYALCASNDCMPDRQMQRLFAMLSTEAAPKVPALAAHLGMSERSLRRRCQEAFGYGAKTLDRILRLQRFLRLAPRHATLTAAALEAGYGDAPHLVRDSQLLTGLTPRELVALRRA